MGLDISVGNLSYMLEENDETTQQVLDHYCQINDLLTNRNHSPHHEPENCQGREWEGYGYSGLHALREVAGLVWRGEPIPRDVLLTGKDKSRGDLLFDAGLPLILGEGKKAGWLSRLMPSKIRPAQPPYLHLIAHSDAEGYYVPVDFPLPLIPDHVRDETASIWPLGSVQRLQDEVNTLRKHLEIPDELNSEDDELIDAVFEDGPKQDGKLWQAQTIATHSALILSEACDYSMKTGAAIAFE